MSEPDVMINAAVARLCHATTVFGVDWRGSGPFFLGGEGRIMDAIRVVIEALRSERAAREAAEAEAERYRVELDIIRCLPLPESNEANTLGWLKARARAALPSPRAGG